MNNLMSLFRNRWALICLVCCWPFYFCSSGESTYVYKYLQPHYINERIVVTDTIGFKLPDKSYNVIKSFNHFSVGEREYIAFYDRTSESVNIYDFENRGIIVNLSLKSLIPDTVFYKTGVFVKNFDTIIVNNYATIYVLDTAGNIKGTIPLQRTPYPAFALFKNYSLPVFKGNVFYTGAWPYLTDNELKSMRKWTVLYKVDMQERKASTSRRLPDVYHSNVYSYFFLSSSYCVNNEDEFVFSFPADTNIYVTNLEDTNFSFYGKSRGQQQDISWIPADLIGTERIDELSFYLNDSYGPIYFDELNKRYLRVAQSKISKADYALKKGKKDQSIIMFDQDFRIISECPVDPDINLFTLFFTKDGGMYAQTDTEDQDSLHFVKLIYK